MPWAARRDPRLDPTLPPEAWAAARRRYRAAWLVALVLGALAVGVGGYAYYTTRDRTRGLTPAQVVEAAGMALIDAGGYRFTAKLTGESPDGFFPDTRLAGEYQRDPLLLHLAGEVGSGPAKTPFEYYLEGDQLYVKQAHSQAWLLAPDADREEVNAFRPDNLAAPLVTGLKAAEPLGREPVGQVEAALFALDLDPAVMQVEPAGDDEQVEYRLWVDIRTLRPARFTIEVARPSGSGSSFQYQIDWEFPRMAPLSVPADVKGAAAGAG